MDSEHGCRKTIKPLMGETRQSFQRRCRVADQFANSAESKYRCREDGCELSKLLVLAWVLVNAFHFAPSDCDCLMASN